MEKFCTGKWYPAFNKKKVTKITRWEKFLLFFCRKHYAIDFGFPEQVVVSKRLRGKIYIVETWVKPPQGYNCRHSFTPSSL